MVYIDDRVKKMIFLRLKPINIHVASNFPSAVYVHVYALRIQNLSPGPRSHEDRRGGALQRSGRTGIHYGPISLHGAEKVTKMSHASVSLAVK